MMRTFLTHAALLFGIALATFGLATISGCLIVERAIDVSDEHPRTTLHVTTAFDLGTTKVGLDGGFSEGNPILDHIIDEHGFEKMVLGQIIINEIVLLWERRACSGKSLFFPWASCRLAGQVRRAMTGAHLVAGGWNASQIVAKKKEE